MANNVNSNKTVVADHAGVDEGPIDMAESLAEQSSWDFDQVGQNQIAMAIEGGWRTYSLTLAWSDHDVMLRLVCTFDLTPPEDRLDAFHALLNLVNDKIWGGNFTLWRSEGLVAFRYGLSLAGGAEATPEQIEAMVLTAIALSEQFYPAFQLVGWGGDGPEAAMRVAIGEHYGTA